MIMDGVFPVSKLSQSSTSTESSDCWPWVSEETFITPAWVCENMKLHSSFNRLFIVGFLCFA